MNLTAALLDAERPLTADEIAERVAGYPEGKEAFRRTFERDKDELRQLGVPIGSEVIPGTLPDEVHGYRIDRADYELPDPGLAADELAALHLALQAVRLGAASRAVDGTEALWKLGGVVGEPDAEPAAPRRCRAVPPSARPVAGAPVQRRARPPRGPLRLRLDPAAMPERVRRALAPRLPAGAAGTSPAHDLDRGEERNFRLDRIRGRGHPRRARDLHRPAAEHAREPDQPWLYGDGEAVTAVLGRCRPGPLGPRPTRRR